METQQKLNEINVQSGKATAAQNENKFKGGYFNSLAGKDKNEFNGNFFSVLAGQSRNKFTVKKGNIIACKYNNTIELTDSGNMVLAANGSRFKGKKGNLICAVEIDDKKELGKILSFKAAIIDGEILKEDVFYAYENGEFVIVA